MRTLVLLVILASFASCAPSSHPSPDSGVAMDPRIAEVRGLLRDGHFDDALERAEALVAEARAAHGPQSLEVARGLDLIAEYNWRSQQAASPQALDPAEEAVEIKRDLGASKAEVATSLRNVAKLLDARGETDRAEKTFRRIADLRESAFGDDSSEYALALFDLAQLYQTTGRPAQAEHVYSQVLEIQGRLPNDPYITYTLNNLAMVHQDLGDYAEARTLYEQALEIKEADAQDCSGRLNVVWTQNALAVLLMEMGEYDDAKTLYDRALAIRRECMGENHPYVALILVNQALLAGDQGDYSEARRLYEQALEIEIASYGRDHAEVIETQYALARLCFEMGDYAEALRLFDEAVSFWDRSPKPDARWMAAALQGLASTLTELGNFARARELQERALSAYEASVGKHHASYALSLDRFAVLMDRIGDRDSAIDLERQALDIRVEALGGEHPDLVRNLQTLAEMQMRKGLVEEPLALLDRAQGIAESSLGQTHPAVARVLADRGLALAAAGDVEGAFDSSLRAEEIGRQHLQGTLRYLSEREALRFAAVRPSGLDEAVTLAVDNPRPGYERRIWDSLCRSRALVLDEMAARNRAMRGPGLAPLVQELEACSRRLANLWIRGPGSLEVDRYRRLIETTTGEVEQAQRALAAQSEAYRIELARETVGLPEVLAALPPRTALVAFVLYDRHEQPGGSKTPSYAAFVVSDRAAEPFVVGLGAASEIDRQVERWHAEAERDVLSEPETVRDAELAYREAGEALRRTIWDPIATRWKQPERVFVVPDGTLNLINLASLPLGPETYLVETGPRVHYVSAERDLVLDAPGQAGGEGLLALGGPDFDASGAVAVTSKPVLRGLPCDDLQSVRFGPLAATLDETEAIVRLWSDSTATSPANQRSPASVRYLTGADANEAAFKKQAPGHRVLHIATHGFFLGGACSSARVATRGVDRLVSESSEPSPPVLVENPLLRSGLALAGANRREQARLDEEDGVLTAAEIATMDLGGVEWAVLSACDTGIGELQAGEGVLGLRRAFAIAGARTTIMSLWAVQDDVTREWMVDLYRAHLSDGLATDEAVRQATLQSLRRAREQGTSHPFYWAGFVAAGNWR